MAERVRYGANKLLEEMATEMILASFDENSTPEEKSMILTPWKTKHRQTHEIMNHTGVAEASIRRGMFHRAYNSEQPHLNSYDCASRPIKMTASWDPEDESQGGAALMDGQMDRILGVERTDD